MSLSEDDIRLCYQLILGREADAGGLEHLYRRATEQNWTNLHTIARLMYQSLEFKQRFGNPLTTQDIFLDLKKIEYSGVSFALPEKDFTYVDLSATGQYEPYLTGHLFALLRPGMTFLDIGANLGLISLPAARLVGPTGRVVAFEASPRNAMLLTKNAAANGLRNISVLPIAASDRNGVAVSRRNLHTSNQRLFQEFQVGHDSELIPTVTLDSFLPSDFPVDVVKIDVEGFEYRVIQGACRLFSTMRPHLYMEYSDLFQKTGSNVSGDDLLNLILSFGYKVTVLHRNAEPELIVSIDQSDTIRQVNAIWQEHVRSGGTHLDLYFSSDAHEHAVPSVGVSERGGRPSTFNTYFRSLFAETLAAADDEARALARSQAEILASQVNEIQQDYQPFYGLGEKGEMSARQNLLLLCVEQVHRHYSDIQRKTKMRILDVGCNAGFVSFSLGETFPLTRGIDTSDVHVDLCQKLAIFTGSPVQFCKANILEIMDSDDVDIENVDCILLLNVVHQLIFARGLAYVQTFLARLASRVDVMFVELAQKEEYKRFQKDHLLPEDPASVFASIQGCSIQLMKSGSGRPLYKIARNSAAFGPLAIPASQIRYNDDAFAAPDQNRKYYRGGGRFLKVFRFVDNKTPSHYRRELHALQTLSGHPAVPRVFDWTATPAYGAILMEEIPGGPLLPSGGSWLSKPSNISSFMASYVGFADALGQAGLYHNDLSAHNILALPAGGVCFIDFEQCDSWAYVDPFAVMLWTLYDVLAGDIVSYKKGIYKQLYVKGGGERGARNAYPDLSKFTMPEGLKGLVDAAMSHVSWFAFASEWSKRLNA